MNDPYNTDKNDERPQRRDLRAMNSDIELVCYAPDAGQRLDRAERWLLAYESRFSRFRALSELSRLNRASGRPFRVSPALYWLIELALELARRSDGVFDPTVLRDLELAGYDRSFELIIGPAAYRRRNGRGCSYRDVVLDPIARTVYLPEGCGIDLGGVGKGYAVDRMAAILGSPCLVNGGGDVFVVGRPHDAPAWLVGIADPFAPDDDLRVLALLDCAVATSTTLRRRWTVTGNETAHHLIDTRTHEPSLTDVVQASILAPTALLADYFAKVALLLGVEAGLRYVNREPGIEGLLVDREGKVYESAGLGAYVGEGRQT